MGKVAKSFKKFSQKNLPKLIKKRRETAQVKNDRRDRAEKKEKRIAQLEEDKIEQQALQEKQQQTLRAIAKVGADEEEEDEEGEGKKSLVEEFMSKGFEEAMQEDDPVGDDDEDEDEEEGDAEDLPDDEEGAEEEEASAEGADEEEKLDDENVGNLEEDVEKHKKELEDLKQADPEFFEYMKQHDPKLLGFVSKGLDALEAEEGEDDLVAGEQDNADVRATKKSISKRILLTSALLEELIGSAATSKRSLRKLLLAFQAGCHIGDEDKESQDKEGKKKKERSLTKYKIVNSEVFNTLMTFCLQNLDHIFDTHLEKSKDGEEKKKKKAKKEGTTLKVKAENIRNNPRWDSVMPFVRSFLSNALGFLSGLVEPTMRQFTIQCLEKYAPYIAQFAPISRRLLRVLLQVWSTAEDEASRFLAFTTIKALSIACPAPYIDLCLKGIYLTYVRSASHVSAASLPMTTFMCNCVVDLFGQDVSASYQHAFVYVRQLAIHLRNALERTSKDAVQNIHTWAFVNALRLWVEVLSSHSQQHEALRHLIFPVTQVALGLIELSPSITDVTVKFHAIRQLLGLCEATGYFVNPVHYLLQVLELAEMNKKPKPSKVKPVEFLSTIRISKQYLGTRELQEGVITQVYELLLRFFAMHSHSISFPELALPAMVFFRRIKNSSSNPTLTRQLASLVEKIQANIDYINKARALVDFSPKDAEKARGFLAEDKEACKSPLGQAWSRYLQQQNKIKELQAQADQNERAKKEASKQQEDDEYSEDEEDHEEGEEDEEDGEMDEEDMEDMDDEGEIEEDGDEPDEEVDFGADEEMMDDDEEEEEEAPAPKKRPQGGFKRPQQRQGGRAPKRFRK